MPFKRGQKKSPGSGRKKGSLNRDKLLVRELLDRHAINLVDRIINLIPNLDPADELRAYLGLMPYVYPRLASMHHVVEQPPPPMKEVGPKTFEQFCIDACYPKPYPKQIEMNQFAMNASVARLLLGSRGYGKTDYVTILTSAYKIYLDAAWSTLIVTKSRERNAAILGEIANACRLNGMKFEKENQSSLRVEGLHGKDHSVSSMTVGSKSARGRHPKMIIMDDCITEDDASEATRNKVQRLYNELSKLCKNILLIGQPVHKFDLYETLRPTLKKMEVPWGTIPELDHDLVAQRLAGVSEESISASYMLKVISENATPFDAVKYVPDFPKADSVAYIDPSFKGGDFTAMSIMRMHLESVQIQGRLFKRAWNHCIDECVDEMEKRGVKRVAIECNSLGDQPVALYRTHPKIRALGIGVVGKDSTGNKHARIMAAGTFAHLIHLSKTSDRSYIDQTVKYEYGAKNDDAPDSLAGVLEWVGLIKGR